MEMNGGFLVTKIKQLGDRIFEKILSEKNIDAFNGAQGRILYVLWQKDGISIKSLSTKCGLAITSLTTMLERMENQGFVGLRLTNHCMYLQWYLELLSEGSEVQILLATGFKAFLTQNSIQKDQFPVWRIEKNGIYLSGHINS